MPAPTAAPGLCSRLRARPPTPGRIRSTAVATYVQRRAGSLSAGSSETQGDSGLRARLTPGADEDALAASAGALTSVSSVPSSRSRACSNLGRPTSCGRARGGMSLVSTMGAPYRLRRRGAGLCHDTSMDSAGRLPKCSSQGWPAPPCGVLLSRHRDPEPLLGRDQVVGVLRRRVDVELNPADRTGEGAVRAVAVADRGRGVASHVGGLVRREEHRHRPLDAPLSDPLAVDEERDVASFPRPPPSYVNSIRTLIAGGDDVGAVDLEPLEAVKRL